MFWQIDYGDGCIGEVIKELLGYKWNVYIPGVEKPIKTGRRLCFINAIEECRYHYSRLINARISRWRKVL